MSRIGKKPIIIPAGVEVKIENGLIKVKGPKGEINRTLDSRLEARLKDGKITIMPKDSANAQKISAVWGLYRALVVNLIKGASSGFEKSLIFQGVGFRALVSGRNLELHLGYSHPLAVKAPDGISFKVEKSKITVSGIDKELVGRIAAEIRAKRKPEPYKGSGLRYENEVIIRKAGKKAVTTG